ncbi:hypothetical protein E8E13_009636 [Curvularia kusanoi]|uniref:Fungal N-terminal domain-containing protein n=1 Tax=Curvularia kusanoi TaxID=90978 RepID=A0A9P4TFW2_CURKU|nr:hypothetical protein E8E13_009636 [Curvularia kusanoi]
MSGLEVAGVVLGALPLIISALEHYTQGVNTAKRYWRYKSELRALKLQIDTERSIFMNTLEQLLTGIVRVEHIADCIDNPGGDCWRDVEIEKRLKVRLGSVHENYIDNVRGMASSLSQIMNKLALDPCGKVRQFNFISYQSRISCSPYLPHLASSDETLGKM